MILYLLFFPNLQRGRQAKDRETAELWLQLQGPGLGAASSSILPAGAEFLGVQGGCGSPLSPQPLQCTGRCFVEVPSNHSTPAGSRMQLSSGRSRLAELQVLVSGDIELEFVFLKELAELLDVELVKLVHLLL